MTRSRPALRRACRILRAPPWLYLADDPRARRRGMEDAMPVKAAAHCYTQERLNCAQSVLKAFRERSAVSPRELEEARSLGGGRAERGVCGALHAALRLVEDPAGKEAVRQGFIDRAGSESCREIRKAGTVSCLQCVEIASGLADEAVPEPR